MSTTSSPIATSEEIPRAATRPAADAELRLRLGPSPRRVAELRVLVTALGHRDRSLELHTNGLIDHLVRSTSSVTVRCGARRPAGPIARAGDELALLTSALVTPRPAPLDLVVTVVPGLRGALGAARLAQRHGIPLVLVVHDLVSAHPQGRYGARNLRVAEATERRLLARAAAVAVVNADLEVVVRTLQVPVERVHLLPRWTTIPAARHDRTVARRMLGWPVRPFTVVHPVTGDRRQDVGTALQALHRLGDVVDVVLVGEGARRAAVQAAELGMAGVRAMVPTDETDRQRAFAAADLLVLTHRSDATGPGAPQSLIDCLGAGRAILAAAPDDCGLAAELDRATGAGLVVRPAEPTTLAAAVRALRLDEDLRASMGEAGLRYARRRLARRAAMFQLDRILETVVATG